MLLPRELVLERRRHNTQVCPSIVKVTAPSALVPFHPFMEEVALECDLGVIGSELFDNLCEKMRYESTLILGVYDGAKAVGIAFGDLDDTTFYLLGTWMIKSHRKWARHLWPVVVEIAKGQGCTQIQGFVTASMARIAEARYGLKPVRVIVRKEI